MNQGFKFLFGKVPADLLTNDNSYFEHADGTKYYFSVTIDNEHVYIADTCGRYVPVDLDFIEQFALAVDSLAEVVQAHNEAQYLLTERLAQISENVQAFKDAIGE